MVLVANVKLYGTARPIVGQSYHGVKRQVVPNQSMSLKEIVRRFVRRESLPLSREGLYESRFGDLEKLSKADIVIQMERVKELQEQIAGFNKREKDRVANELLQKQTRDKEIFDAAVKAATPAGEGTIKSPPPKGA